MRVQRRILLMLAVPLTLLVIGTLGYWVIEPEYSLFDSFYMTVITITTVGYGEVWPLSMLGRWFTIVLLLSGVFTVFFAASEILRVMISGELHDILGRRAMAKSLAGLSNHLIVCGYGRMGRFVCQEFSRQGEAFVVIDRNEAILNDFKLTGGIALPGDATTDEVLRRGGVDRARALVTVAPSDADNLYITMSARLLNSKLFIVARAESEEAEQKLLRAGADRAIAPYAIGGTKVAQAVLRPTVLDFIELATRTEHVELQIEQVNVSPRSKLVGATLTSARLRQDFGLIIVAIKKAPGEMIYTPSPEAVMEAGDTLLALGRRSQLDQLEQLARGAS